MPVPEAVGTRLGTDDGFRAVVDARSAVQPAGAGHRVEWWIGGDDRWYAPAVEAAVRQDRPGPAPVLETRMRVAGGDVVATTWAAVASGSSSIPTTSASISVLIPWLYIGPWLRRCTIMSSGRW